MTVHATITSRGTTAVSRGVFLTLALCAALPRWAVVEANEPVTIRNKTLVAWVTVADLHQRGGSVLTLEKPGGDFDAIVFGELAPAKWMAGSGQFARTNREQQTWPKETADPRTLVQLAIVYRGKQITIYRNGDEYCSYTAKEQASFGQGSHVLMGLRHLQAAPANRFFTGSIEDARIYGVALSAEQIASLKPNRPSTPKPLAWWDFEEGNAKDRMGVFPVSTLVGNCRIAGGRLHLGSGGAYLMASNEEPKAKPDRNNEANVVARRLREKLLSDPHRPGYHFVVPEGRCMPRISLRHPRGALHALRSERSDLLERTIPSLLHLSR